MGNKHILSTKCLERQKCMWVDAHICLREGPWQQAIKARLDKLQAVARPRQEKRRWKAVPLITNADMLHRSAGTCDLQESKHL